MSRFFSFVIVHLLANIEKVAKFMRLEARSNFAKESRVLQIVAIVPILISMGLFFYF